MEFSPKKILSFNNKKNNANSTFEENVKGSFKKAREHMDKLEKDLESQKTLISSQNEQINKLLDRIETLTDQITRIKTENDQKQVSSSGNQGVWTDRYSIPKHSLNIKHKAQNSQICVKEPEITIAKSFDNIVEMCNSLSKQELLTFLVLYELEEEIGNVTYRDISLKMGISDGCVRTYICSLIKKGLPISKKRFNNKIIYLTILPEFRALNPKKELESVYYQFDPNQKRLIDNFY